MIKNIYFIFVLLVTFSCSNPKSEKQKELADFLPQNEIEEIANKIQNYLQEKKGAQVYSLFDGDEFYKCLSAASRQNPKVRIKEVARLAADNFVKSMSNSLDNSSDSVKIYWIEAKEQKGDYVQLSFIWNDAKDLNFFELFLTRNEKGKIVICDYLSYMSGEKVSTSLDKFIANRVKYGEDPNSEMGKSMLKLNEISKLLALQNYEEAYSMYQSIPLPFSKERAFLNRKLEITSELSAQLYIETLEEFINAETCKECKSLYKFYIALTEEDKSKQHLCWNKLKNNYKNKEKLVLIEKSYFSSINSSLSKK